MATACIPQITFAFEPKAKPIVAAFEMPSWQWPIDVTHYDRSPRLTAPESRALARIGDGVRAWPCLGQQQPAWRALARLVRPLADDCALLVSESQRHRRCADAAVAAICAAANAVPYELYDDLSARTKVASAEGGDRVAQVQYTPEEFEEKREEFGIVRIAWKRASCSDSIHQARVK